MEKNGTKSTLKKRIKNLINGWECLEKKLKDLPEDNPMRDAVPALISCRKQLNNIVNNKTEDNKE